MMDVSLCGDGMQKSTRQALVVIAVIAVIAVALVGAYAGYDTYNENSKKREELRREFAKLKEDAKTEMGAQRADKLVAAGNIDAAIELLEREIKEGKPAADMRIKLAELYEKGGKREDAILQYSIALQNEPQNRDALEKQTALLVDEGRIASACTNLETLLTLDPNDIDTRYRLANLQYQNKNYPSASENYSKILVLKGEDAIALQGLGHIMMLRNQPSEALGYYERTVAVDPSSAEAWFFIARISLYNEKFERAVEALRKAIALNYPERELRLWLAAALETLGRIPEAIPEYKRFIAENPGHPKVDTIKLHVSELEFWEAPEHFEAHQAMPDAPTPWGDTLDSGSTPPPAPQGKKPWE
jgi:tetratricopeptide (TPR) repeat protein